MGSELLPDKLSRELFSCYCAFKRPFLGATSGTVGLTRVLIEATRNKYNKETTHEQNLTEKLHMSQNNTHTKRTRVNNSMAR
jgi:hypothetical protein